jgi:hypothetical protein
VVNPSPGGVSAASTITTYQYVSGNFNALVSVPATGLLYSAVPILNAQAGRLWPRSAAAPSVIHTGEKTGTRRSHCRCDRLRISEPVGMWWWQQRHDHKSPITRHISRDIQADGHSHGGECDGRPVPHACRAIASYNAAGQGVQNDTLSCSFLLMPGIGRGKSQIPHRDYGFRVHAGYANRVPVALLPFRLVCVMSNLRKAHRNRWYEE